MSLFHALHYYHSVKIILWIVISIRQNNVTINAKVHTSCQFLLLETLREWYIQKMINQLSHERSWYYWYCLPWPSEISHIPGLLVGNSPVPPLHPVPWLFNLNRSNGWWFVEVRDFMTSDPCQYIHWLSEKRGRWIESEYNCFDRLSTCCRYGNLECSEKGKFGCITTFCSATNGSYHRICIVYIVA